MKQAQFDQLHETLLTMLDATIHRNVMFAKSEERAVEAHIIYRRSQQAHMRVLEKIQQGENVADEEMPDLICILADYCSLSRNSGDRKDSFLAAQRILERIKMDPTYKACVEGDLDESMQKLVDAASKPWIPNFVSLPEEDVVAESQKITEDQCEEKRKEMEEE